MPEETLVSMAQSRMADGRRIRDTIKDIDADVLAKSAELRILRRRRNQAVTQLLNLHAAPDEPQLPFDDEQ